MTDLITDSAGASAKTSGRLADYVAIARLDHSTKHIFIVPGIVFAYLLRGIHTPAPLLMMVLGLLTAIFIASANYAINEWLDRDFDRHHPTKQHRSAVQRELHGAIVWLEWLLLVTAGLACAYAANRIMLVVAAVFALQGLVYNVPPIRTKDKPYLDVVSESINNPLRLMIGWTMLDGTSLPPGSIILAYWLGGAFLMGVKRLSEYREIAAAHGPELLARYRKSFAGYSETSLLVSCFVYAMLSSFFLAVFLLKYRIEYVTLMPLVTILFGHYLALALQPGSSAQRPERLFHERRLMALVALLCLAFAAMTVVSIPALGPLTEQHYIVLE